MTGLGDLVWVPSASALGVFFFFFLLSGSSLGSLAALLKLLRLLDSEREFTSEIPPSLVRLLFLFLLAFFSSFSLWVLGFMLSLTESSTSDMPVVELLDVSKAESLSDIPLSVNRTILNLGNG